MVNNGEVRLAFTVNYIRAVETYHLKVSSPGELPAAAQKILQLAKGRKVFAVYGPMGSGKTTLIKELCRQLGSNDNFSSPTYSIVNEYKLETQNSKPETKNPLQVIRQSSLIYHIDLYRLKTLHEALQAGVGEYINGEYYCFIEWPELIEPLLPADQPAGKAGLVKLEIKMSENMREITIFIG